MNDFTVALVIALGFGFFLTAIALLRQKRRLQIMASILADLQATDAKVDAAIVRVTEDVDELRRRIAELEAEAANRELTPEESALLTALQAKLDGLDPIVPVALKPEHRPKKGKK